MLRTAVHRGCIPSQAARHIRHVAVQRGPAVHTSAANQDAAIGEQHEVVVGYKDLPAKGKVRLDAYLSSCLPSISRARLQASIKEGGVIVNGKALTKASAAVKAGDRILCTVQPLPPLQAVPEDIPLDIVYEDEHLMVINKAAGMVVHPSPGHSSGTLVNALLHHCGLPALCIALGSQRPTDPDSSQEQQQQSSSTTASYTPQSAGSTSSGDVRRYRAGNDTYHTTHNTHNIPSSDHEPVADIGGAEGSQPISISVNGAGRSVDGGNGAQDGDDFEEDEEEDVTNISFLPAAVSGQGAAAVIRPGIVHRLDKGTSGLLVVAKDERSHQHLCDQFKARTVDRIYWSLTIGTPHPREGEIETNIGRCTSDRKKMAAYAFGSSRGRVAGSRYGVLEELMGGRAALVEWKLRTGRTHQIRVHAKHIGHPLLCDEAYGATVGMSAAALAEKNPSQLPKAKELMARLGRPALHALTLGFEHPVTGQRLHFASDPAPDLAATIEALRAPALATE